MFVANMAPPTGIEPVPAVPETAVLSIKLWRRTTKYTTAKIKAAKRRLSDSVICYGDYFAAAATGF